MVENYEVSNKIFITTSRLHILPLSPTNRNEIYNYNYSFLIDINVNFSLLYNIESNPEKDKHNRECHRYAYWTYWRKEFR